MKFQVFIKTKILKIKSDFAFKLSDGVFIMLINVKSWHFNIHEQDKFRALLS